MNKMTINKNMFKELELQIAGLDIKSAEDLCDSIYEKVKSLRFKKIENRYILHKFGYRYALFLGEEYNIEIKEYGIHYEFHIVKWNHLSIHNKIHLIYSLPDFFKSIEQYHTNLTYSMKQFVDTFKHINLTDT